MTTPATLRLTTRGRKAVETVHLAKEGIAFPEIAKMVGSTVKAVKVVVSQARKRGEKFPPQPRHVTMAERAAQMVLEGATIAEAANVLGSTPRSIQVQISKVRRRGGAVPLLTAKQRKDRKKQTEVTGLKVQAILGPVPSPKFRSDAAARLREIPVDTRTPVQIMMGDPIPNDPRRAA